MDVRFELSLELSGCGIMWDLSLVEYERMWDHVGSELSWVRVDVGSSGMQVEPMIS